MRYLIFVLIFISNLSFSNEKEEIIEEKFLAALTVKTLTLDEKEIELEIYCLVNIDVINRKKCVAETPDDLYELIIKPIVRSSVRYFIGRLKYMDKDKIDKVEIEEFINNWLLNDKNIKDCALQIEIIYFDEVDKE